MEEEDTMRAQAIMKRSIMSDETMKGEKGLYECSRCQWTFIQNFLREYTHHQLMPTAFPLLDPYVFLLRHARDFQII